MTVYHASNVEVKHPMLVESNRLLDFGPGFYTTSNREQAVHQIGGTVMDSKKYATMLAVLISPAVVGILADHLKLDETAAMEKFMTSRLYAALADEGQKLWHFSPELLASLVEEELKTEKFTYPQEAL